MATTGTIRKILIASPTDVSPRDLEIVLRTVEHWNALYGIPFASVFIPIHWSINASPEHGVRPQEAVNRQLGDDCDAVLAIFWNRLGTPSGAAESGTVEEIERAANEGKPVGVLHCTREVKASELDLDQLSDLKRFLGTIRESSLVLDYDTDHQLARHTETFLTRAQAVSQTVTDVLHSGSLTPGTSGGDHGVARADVRARVEREETMKATAKGLRPTSRHYLVLENVGSGPAENVRFELRPEAGDEAEQLPRVIDADRVLPRLLATDHARYPMAVSMGSVSQATVVTRWSDAAGDHEQVTSLRLY